MAAIEFAVLDVETTGFMPETGDRLVEIAVLRLDARGRILRSFHTVVNPERDLGRAKTHALKPEDIEKAPKFAEIAGDLVDFFAGAVVISHNVIFDWLFIKEEFKRLGHKIPRVPNICTLELARRLVPEPKSRRLNDVCKELGLTYGEARNALEEARATRFLFLQGLKMLGNVKSVRDLGVTDAPPDRSAWPDLPVSGKYQTRAEVKSQAPTGTAAATETPETAAPEPVSHDSPVESQPSFMEQYLVLLEEVLEDRVVTENELAVMDQLAKDHGINKGERERAHKIYMKELFKASLQDGKISKGEKKDLEQVRTLLGLSNMDYTRVADEAKREFSRSPEPASFIVSKKDIQGKTVSFADDPQCKIKGTVPSRMFAESMAAEAGLVIENQITSRLDYLVVPDMKETSADLEEAREYGVRILAEPVFWRMIGADIL